MWRRANERAQFGTEIAAYKMQGQIKCTTVIFLEVRKCDEEKVLLISHAVLITISSSSTWSNEHQSTHHTHPPKQSTL